MTKRYTNNKGTEIALAVFLAHDEYDHKPGEKDISVTGLLKPIREIVLTARVEPDDAMPDISGLVASRVGTAVHTGLETAWTNHYRTSMEALGYPKRVIDMIRINPTDEEVEAGGKSIIPVYMEMRETKEVDGVTVSGKYDFVIEGEVQDLKNTSCFTYIHKTNDKKYSQQGSMYRWLNPKKITKDTIAIHFIFSDWSAMGLQRDPKNYPPAKAMTYRVALAPVEEVEKFVRNKLKQIAILWDAPEEDLPRCSDEDLWRKDPTFKYYKNPEKMSRSTKNFDNDYDAQTQLQKDGNVGIVVEVKGEVVACRYCNASSKCTQKDDYILEGLLKM